jgi:SAD/SRA domain-containing protein
MARSFGEVPGNPSGTTYHSRPELAAARVHMARLPRVPSEIPCRRGESGGRDPATGAQIADQHFKAQNLALVKSEAESLPVRVTRGAAGDPAFPPTSGFRYDGLFRVEESWREPGRSGFYVCRYRLVRLADDGTPVPSVDRFAAANRRSRDRPLAAGVPPRTPRPDFLELRESQVLRSGPRRLRHKRLQLRGGGGVVLRRGILCLV